MVVLLQRCNWDYRDEEARKMHWSYCSGWCTTKPILEDANRDIRLLQKKSHSKAVNDFVLFANMQKRKCFATMEDEAHENGCVGRGHLVLPESDFERISVGTPSMLGTVILRPLIPIRRCRRIQMCRSQHSPRSHTM